MAYPSAPRPLKVKYLTTYMPNITVPSSAFVTAPYTGRIVEIRSVVAAQLGTTNTALTLEINDNAISGATATVAHSGAAGDTDEFTLPAMGVPVVEGDSVEIVSDGAADNGTVPANFTIAFKRGE